MKEVDDAKPQRWAPPEGEALVAHNLKVLRMTARLSQEDMAERMRRLGFKMHQTQIAKIENGARSVSLNEALGFARALGVPAGHFLLEAVASRDDPHWELQEAAFGIQKAEQEHQVAQDLADAAKTRLEAAEARYDEIAERLGVEPDPGSLSFYPAPNSPGDPLRSGSADDE
ncbi:helix-turn-helix domain-containing protein [Streptomyces griseoluteus]|uniref:helix-turn-helix domain-containing protein n=1 Tax=Streptomyces griseoluteus TaxID=29306 RepID=UPI00381705EB